MPASQKNVSINTPMGATLTADGGATFRVWAPAAKEVYALGDFNEWTRNDAALLVKHDDQRWTGYFPNVRDGMKYKFWVSGHGSEGFKRDPYARELTPTDSRDCIVRAANSYPWQDWSWRTPSFNDLVIYQFHVGTFFGPDRERRVAKFLDVLNRIEYLEDLGVNAIEPLPIVESNSPRSLGYEGVDIFSPEMGYQVPPDQIQGYVGLANRLLVAKGRGPLTREVLEPGVNQLKTLIDICHAYGIAVIFDVVYNHASLAVKDQDESLWFMDRQRDGNPNNSLYFTEQDHLGPVFAFWKEEVRQFLIDNAGFCVEEYHVDGFRNDRVDVIDLQNRGAGWLFCQDLNAELRSLDPSAINIAEYWGPEPAVVRPQFEGGADFHATWHNGLRSAIRQVIGQASGGRDVSLNWQPVVDHLRAPGFRDAWRVVQHIENHDEVYRDRDPRIPKLAVGGGDTRNWYGRSRSRVATGLLLTAPGIPMLFMGQEFYEDKRWADDPEHHPNTLIFWDGLASEKTVSDFHRFTRDLIWLRRKHPGLRGEGVATILMDNFTRVLAFQRWIPGFGRDLVIVASLNEFTQHGYRIPFPGRGEWLEVFNSDIYENWVNPATAGNGMRVFANGPAWNGLETSADIVVPANSLLVFARDMGDF